MGNTLTSTKGGPVFTNTPTQTALDMNAGRQFTEKMGNRINDTAANRAVASPVWVGLEWYETDTGISYMYTSSGWVIWLQPWTDFTPTTTGFNVGGGGSLRYGKYRVLNGEVQVRVGWVLGTSPTVNDVNITYPVPIASWLNDLAQIGQATFYDQSAGTSGRIRGPLYKTSSAIRVTYEATGNVMLPLGVSAPFAWTSGDEIHIAATYPA